MNDIHIHKHLDSDTLYLPELKPFVGKTVEITIREELSPQKTTCEWDAALRAARELEDYDFEAYRKQRDFDLLHSKDHLP